MTLPEILLDSLPTDAMRALYEAWQNVSQVPRVDESDLKNTGVSASDYQLGRKDGLVAAASIIQDLMLQQAQGIPEQQLFGHPVVVNPDMPPMPDIEMRELTKEDAKRFVEGP